jgi:hypothetical protein
MTGPGIPPVYASDQEFFELYLSTLFARNKRFTWCSEWQDHEEAAFVVKVLHDSWELTTATMPTEIGVWLGTYAYPLFFDRLCAPDGTFSECNWQNSTHQLPLQLTTE